jgi:hypothetical protein
MYYTGEVGFIPRFNREVDRYTSTLRSMIISDSSSEQTIGGGGGGGGGGSAGLSSICVLRNLSKREYVREDVLLQIAANAEATQHLASSPIGDFVHYGMAWSGDYSCLGCGWYADLLRGETTDLHRGRWAGDRFDLATLDDIQNNSNGTKPKWKDVTMWLHQKAEEFERE